MKLRDSNGETNHIVPLSNGVLRQPHIERIGTAFPLFAKLEDLVTTGEGSDGLVWGGKPIPDQALADMLGLHRKTIAVWRRNRLQKHGYIVSKATPAGNIIRVRKSKKWFWLRSRREQQAGMTPLPGGTVPTAEVGAKKGGGGSENGSRWESKRDTKQDVAGPNKDVVGTTAASDNTAWKEIGLDSPVGTPDFQSSWEFFSKHRNGEPLSNAMERCIQNRQKKRLSVPKPFFTAKRAVEDREKSQQHPEAANDNPSPPSNQLSERGAQRLKEYDLVQ
jgi:hypothetical protein